MTGNITRSAVLDHQASSILLAFFEPDSKKHNFDDDERQEGKDRNDYIHASLLTQSS
jgi:hypothetical protein